MAGVMIGRPFYIAVVSDTMHRDREVKLSFLLRPLGPVSGPIDRSQLPAVPGS
jgi:hypothetical protein